MPDTRPETRDYRLLTGSHTFKGKTYFAGDKDNNTLSLTEKEAKNLGERVRLIGAAEDTSANATALSTSKVDIAPSAPKGFFSTEWNSERLASATGPQLIEGVQEISDLEVLDAIHTMEEKGKARKTVLQAITDRYRDVEAAQKDAEKAQATV